MKNFPNLKIFPNLTGPKRTLAQTSGVVVIMASLGWAAVPMYQWFCATTGFGGTPLRADANQNEILDRTINVRFDATVDLSLPWTVTPVERVVPIRLGETGLAFYEATNTADHTIAGYAAYNLAPYAADGYFNKIQCFCFDLQILEPGETILMPVSYFVDPEIAQDSEGKYVHTITLSYTFHQTELPADYVAPDAAREQATPSLPETTRRQAALTTAAGPVIALN